MQNVKLLLDPYSTTFVQPDRPERIAGTKKEREWSEARGGSPCRLGHAFTNVLNGKLKFHMLQQL
jgi:hypothetical protein